MFKKIVPSIFFPGITSNFHFELTSILNQLPSSILFDCNRGGTALCYVLRHITIIMFPYIFIDSLEMEVQSDCCLDM